MNEFRNLVLPAIYIIVLTSCAKPEASLGKIPATSLKYAGAVYNKFEKELKNDPKDNGFVRFASNPRNYDAAVVADPSGVTFIFTLNPYHGREVLDGRIKYHVTEGGKIEIIDKL